MFYTLKVVVVVVVVVVKVVAVVVEEEVWALEIRMPKFCESVSS